MGGSEMKSKGTITRARETVLAAGKSAAERTKVLVGKVADAAATAGVAAKEASTAAVSAALGTVATSIQTRAAKGANALAGERTTTTSSVKKKLSKRMAAKKRAAPKAKQGKSPTRFKKKSKRTTS
jgi:hypothetical protein